MIVYIVVHEIYKSRMALFLILSQVLVQGENTGIRYQYNLAITNHSQNGTEFVWQYTPWSECSRSCAKGRVVNMFTTFIT